MKNLEVLSPAGNLESFYAAINNGADAVYLGLSSFNARGNIENFSLDNLESVIKYAHIFNVKVFLALNILFSDEQLKEALQIVEDALKMHVDAFIVQDLGLALAIRKTFPQAILHASTQMGVCNLEGAQVLKSLGFSRVVLARETKLEEIERIHKNCNIEIEFFVQGALCVSYSGNCYVSSLCAGASGNMGKCKQFCRLPYTLVDGKEKREGFFLSAKDFCMLEKLKALAKAGVCSFKIEGRARRAGYVAAATAVYCNAVKQLCAEQGCQPCETKQKDVVFSNSKSFDVLQAKKQLKLAFNRGDFVAGYFDDEKMIDPKIQGHRGVRIGKVLNVSFGKKFNVVTIESKHNISRGDGLKFLLDGKELASIGAGDVKQISNNVFQLTTLAKVKTGSDVHLTLDVKNEEKLLKKQKKIQIYAHFCAKSGQLAVLKLVEKQSKVEISVQSEAACQDACKQPLTDQEVKTQLSKGCEMFELVFEKVQLERAFLPKSQLNEMRRQAIEKMKMALIEQFESKAKPFEKCKANFDCKNVNLNPQKLFLFSSLSQLEGIEAKDCKLVFCPQNFSRAHIKTVCDKLKNFQVFLSLPFFAQEKDLQLFRAILQDNKQLGIFANNLYAIKLAENRKVIASHNLNVFNSLSVCALSKLGAKDIVVSIEQDGAIKNCSCNLYALENHRPVMMNFVHCPFKEHFSSSCKACKFHDGVFFQMQNGKKFQLVRTKAESCTFSILAENRISKTLPGCGKAICLF